MRKVLFTAILGLSLAAPSALSAQTHLGVNAGQIVTISFARTEGTMQATVLVCQNGVQSIQATDGTGIWHVPHGKKLVLLSMQVEGNCLQPYTSPSGFTFMTLCRAADGSQVGFPYMTELPKRSYLQNEIFIANSTRPAGIVIPAGGGLQPQAFNLDNPPPSTSYVVSYSGYYTHD
jgi:hypothetical protein